jgi:hypothetical protein
MRSADGPASLDRDANARAVQVVHRDRETALGVAGSHVRQTWARQPPPSQAGLERHAADRWIRRLANAVKRVARDATASSVSPPAAARSAATGPTIERSGAHDFPNSLAESHASVARAKCRA